MSNDNVDLLFKKLVDAYKTVKDRFAADFRTGRYIPMDSVELKPDGMEFSFCGCTFVLIGRPYIQVQTVGFRTFERDENGSFKHIKELSFTTSNGQGLFFATEAFELPDFVPEYCKRLLAYLKETYQKPE